MSDDADMQARSGPPRRTRFGGLRLPRAAAARRPHFRLGAVIAVAVAAGLVVWLVLRNDGSSSSTPDPVPGAHAMTAAKLATLARSIRHPVFWLGPKRTRRTRSPRPGREDLRPLPAEGGDARRRQAVPDGRDLPVPGLRGDQSRRARRRDDRKARSRRPGRARPGYPQSVHLAYPGLDYQVEVYDPTPSRAMRLVSAGRLRALRQPSGDDTGRTSDGARKPPRPPS